MAYLSCALFGVAIGWVFGYQTGRHLSNTSKIQKIIVNKQGKKGEDDEVQTG